MPIDDTVIEKHVQSTLFAALEEALQKHGLSYNDVVTVKRTCQDATIAMRGQLAEDLLKKGRFVTLLDNGEPNEYDNTPFLAHTKGRVFFTTVSDERGIYKIDFLPLNPYGKEAVEHIHT